LYCFNPFFSPCPDLRRDKVDYRDAQFFGKAGHPQIKTREIDEDNKGRPGIYDMFFYRSQRAKNVSCFREDLTDAGD